MKGDTLLDYAEFQLTPKRTRCELFISADGLTEKLASGFVKPFVTHLRAAEIQVARGNQVIRLESHGRFSKLHHQQQSDNAWFSKGTLERFVRFVSTPEVIERVKTIEDELAQLEQVRSALANTFAQNQDRFACSDSINGFHQRRDGTHIVSRSHSTEAEDNEADASKRELLRAMEARLSALHQEQSMAFSRANAAGFDNNNIVGLMTFAEHFGADRLNDACVQFLALSRKRTVSEGVHIQLDSPTTEAPSNGFELTLASGNETKVFSGEEAWIHGPKRRLDFGVTKVQTDHLELEVEGGSRTAIIPAVMSALTQQPLRDSSQKCVFGLGPGDQRSGSASAGGMFVARLPRMAQQVEARSSQDFGWPMDLEMSDQSPQSSQISVPDFHSWKEPARTSENHGQQAAGDQSHSQSHIHVRHSTSSLPEMSSSLPALRVRVESPRLWNPSSVEAQSAKDLSSEDGKIKAKDSFKKREEISAMETDSSNNQNTKEETPARRLSVQAAISLFESKKKDSSEPPFRKLVKQESRKASIESGNSPSEKSVLKRWSGTNPLSPGDNNLQEKNTLDSGGVERNLEPEFMKVEVASKVTSSDRMLDSQSQSVPDEQARENLKKSLNNLLHLDSTQQPEKGGISKGADAEVQQVKQWPPIQQPSDNTAGTNPGLKSQDQLRVDHARNLARTGVDAAASLKTKVDPTITVMPTAVKSFKFTVSEAKTEDQSIPNSLTLDLNGKTRQEDKGSLEGHSTKEILPRPSESVSHRSKMSAQVSMEHDNMEPVVSAVPKQEQVSGKRSETVKLKESSAGSDSPSGNNTSSGKISVHRKRSSGREPSTTLLTAPVDLHMQALVKMVENQYSTLSFSGEEIPNEQRGRFYDQYSRLRDAKLRGEHPAKRAEREAKLKSMQETLERRKSEMEERAVRLSKKNPRSAQLGGEKARPQKGGLLVAEVEQKYLKDEEEGTDQEEYSLRFQDQSLEYSNPTSPASTPRSSKNRSSSLKPRAMTKAAPTLSKSSSSPRNSVRAAVLSPRITLKNPVGTPSQGKSPSPINASMDSSTVKAVPNMTEWKKDVAKSSSRRATASAKIHPKFNVSSSAVGDAMSLADDGNNVAIGDAMSGITEKEELRSLSSITRRIVGPISIPKSLPAEAVDGTQLGSPKDQQEGATDPMADGKSRQSTLGVTQEVKPFLRKGRGIGPGAGPGIMKQKASVPVDTSKSSDEDTPTDCKLDGVAVDSEDLRSTVEDSVEAHGTDDVCGVVEQEACNRRTGSGEVETLDYLPENASENGKVYSDTPSPNELSEENPEGVMPEDIFSAAQGSLLQIVNCKQKEGTLLPSDLVAQRNAESLQHSAGFVTSSMSLREVPLPHGQIARPFVPVSASQAYSSILQGGAVSGRFSPPGANLLDLPISSPALWNASPAKYMPAETDLIHSGRQVSGPQKPASMLPLPPKEPSKGFKRLLHFGRKSRPSETAATDCVSVSTTSEGDDDADEVREYGGQLSDDLLRRIRMQKRGFEYGNMGDHYSFPDQETAQFFGSSIPAPPANFKLREEHISGIKAPRSFFSLSSFRSKGSEGKSR